MGKIDKAQEALDRGEISRKEYWKRTSVAVGQAAASYAVGGAAGAVGGRLAGAAIRQRFGTPNLGSAKEKTMMWAIKTGKIQAGEAGLRSLRREIEVILGMEADVSVVLRGGPFDNSAVIPLP